MEHWGRRPWQRPQSGGRGRRAIRHCNAVSLCGQSRVDLAVPAAGLVPRPPAPSSGRAPTGGPWQLGDRPLLTHGRLSPAIVAIYRDHLCVTTGQVGMAATQLERPAIDPCGRPAWAPGCLTRHRPQQHPWAHPSWPIPRACVAPLSRKSHETRSFLRLSGWQPQPPTALPRPERWPQPPSPATEHAVLSRSPGPP